MATSEDFPPTAPHKTIQRDPPDAVLYDLSHPSHVTITLPTRSTWTSGLHWHEHHVEYLRVVRGSIRLTLGSSQTTRIISAGGPKHLYSESGGGGGDEDDDQNEVRIDRGVWHEWRRADIESGEDVVVIERTEPEDGEKTVFFWNLNGVLLKASKGGMPCPPYMPKRVHDLLVRIWVTLGLFTIFHKLDNVPVFVNVLRAFSERGFTFREGTLGHTLLRSVDLMVSHLLLFVASGMASIFGIVAVRDSFTPAEARRRWVEKMREEKSGKVE